MTTTRIDERQTSHRTHYEPTPASTWEAMAGGPITDELLAWPPDLFALTEMILERSQAYRFVFSPPAGKEWPPRRPPSWAEAVEEAGRDWSVWVQDRQAAAPGLLSEEWLAFCERAETPLEHLAEAGDWRLCEAVLTLHAIADEACAGLGVALDSPGGQGCTFRARARELLARTGSLARISSHSLRVLPKARTTPNGTSIRSLSRYACIQRPGVEVRWHKVPARHAETDPRTDHANLLFLPWPLRVRESDFRPVKGSVHSLTKDPLGLFEFAPSEGLDLDLLSRVLVAARDEVEAVDCVILPESAVDEGDINDLEAVLDRHGVVMLITGVRQHSSQPGQLPSSWVHTGLSPRLEKGSPLPDATGEPWFHIRQHKHHRWSLDEAQIYQYHLGSALHPHVRWWEAIEVPRQRLHILELGEQITIVSLVCEDLAQIDDVADIIRSVGPTVVVALLLDGPQLRSRSAARYASVLADDPGSAVATLTSFGMAQRSRPQGRESSPMIALWTDPGGGTREIPLEAGAHGVLLTTCGGNGARRTVDGRWPVENVTNWFDVGLSQIRAATGGSGSPSSVPHRTMPLLLDIDEITILTSFAQAVAEGVACAPDRVEDVMADAHGGAPWRADLGIAEPSPRLSEAFQFVTQAVKGAASSDGSLSLDALLAEVTDQVGEEGLDRLARRVLRSTLEQRRFRTSG